MKDSPPREILSAIHAVAEGGSYFPEDVRAKFIIYLRQPPEEVEP